MGQYYMYLRKSRTDRDAELHGSGETLLRHEKALMDLAARQKLKITKIFREIVSGETIAARPEIQKLLSEVAAGIPDGVLVMEIERLARGDTKDQGTVAETFQMGNVKIITPLKTYDPNDEFDEEYFEFGLFMSRREYKTINRRIQRGRLASVKEGKYIASTAPYGYERVRIANGKGFTLQILPDQARVVRMIYDLYLGCEPQPDGSYHRTGMARIAQKLDTMHIPPARAVSWSRSTIKDILTNPVYIGKVRWQWRESVKCIENGSFCRKRKKNNDCMLCDGLHTAIIDEAKFQKVQDLLSRHVCTPVSRNQTLKNPLSGIVICGLCGRTMTRIHSNTRKNYDVLSCPNHCCSNVSAPLYLIEEKILDALDKWLGGYDLDQVLPPPVSPSSQRPVIENSLARCRRRQKDLETQLEAACDFLERGVYTIDLFRQRSSTIQTQLAALREDIRELETVYKPDSPEKQPSEDDLESIKTIPDLYRQIDSIPMKNELLRAVLHKVLYTKEHPNKKGQLDRAEFALVLYPRLPRA